MAILKDKIVKRKAGTIATSIGTCLELFEDCTARFFANPGKRPNFLFTHPDGQQSSVLLSSGLVPEFEAGSLDKGSILKLPVYVVDKNAQGEPLTDEEGNPLTLMIAGKPAGGEGFDMSKIKANKIKDYEPANVHSFDEYLS